jgi:Putative metallopeptidase
MQRSLERLVLEHRTNSLLRIPGRDAAECAEGDDGSRFLARRRDCRAVYYVVAHEFGHAVFHLLDVPSFGNAEDIADQFSAYMVLLLGKDDAPRLIGGAAYSYKSIMENSNVILPVKAFSDVHGLPPQRFYNLLCMAYGET